MVTRLGWIGVDPPSGVEAAGAKIASRSSKRVDADFFKKKRNLKII